MSVHLPPSSNTSDVDDRESDLSSEEEEDDQTWDDWVSDSIDKQGCRSLFDDKLLKGAEEALLYDKKVHGFDLNETCSKLSLDAYGRIRLINFIRKTKPTPENIASLQGSESFLSSDAYLVPVIEDDPLLQFNSEEWSDSDDDETVSDPARRIAALEKKLTRAKQEFDEYRSVISQRLNISTLMEDAGPSAPIPNARDDDTHYFQSYGENDIHAVMIQDKVRTSSYAHFILTNPSLFRDAIVLDVGCGTGILSLFAARAGAKRVFAVDASSIAIKAEQIVKANGLEDTITVIRGKVEDIQLPDGITHVDIIISEWMGYALLYESMLDSVLVARDRFLRKEVVDGDPAGVMAPSQCKMMLSLCDATEVLKDRVTFWNDVYGFDLSTMAGGLYDEAIVDVVGPNATLSAPATVKDLYLSTITTRQLNFSSPFTLVSTAERKTKVHALLLYFDTFFTVSGKPVSPATEVKVIKEDDVVLAEVWPVGGKPAPKRRASQSREIEKITSFSTGPQSIPTHWKQTLFMLREPISVEEGTVVQGQFHCRKSETNTRELDIEIHYTVKHPGESAESSDLVVQMFKVR